MQCISIVNQCTINFLTHSSIYSSILSGWGIQRPENSLQGCFDHFFELPKMPFGPEFQKERLVRIVLLFLKITAVLESDRSSSPEAFKISSQLQNPGKLLGQMIF